MSTAKRRQPARSKRRSTQRSDTVEQITLYLHTETADGKLVAEFWDELSRGTQGAFNHEVVKIVASYLRHIGWGGELPQQPPKELPRMPYQQQYRPAPQQYDPEPHEEVQGRGRAREIPMNDDEPWGNTPR